MRLEVKEYAEIANEFEALVHFFCNLVSDTRHNIGLVLPHMNATMRYINVIADALEPRDNKPLSDIDRNDVKSSVHGLANRMQKMLELSCENSLQSKKLKERIFTLKKDLVVKGEIAKSRISIANKIRSLVPMGTTTVSGGAVGSMIGSVNFGDVGALVVAGTTFNPIAAVILQ